MGGVLHILIIQHARVETAGSMGRFLEEDGHTSQVVHLDEGECIPEDTNIDGLWVLGGPMDVWEEDKLPWLKYEKAFIHSQVKDKGVPFLGICLGHQLLAESLGGHVAKSINPEVGVLTVSLTENGQTGVFFDGLPENFKALQWHGAEIVKLPPGAKTLAWSEDCHIQAMQWETRAFSVQFHLEIEEDTVRNWANIPEYRASLNETMGENGFEKMQNACLANIADMKEKAERLYINWMQAIAQT